MSTKRGTFWVQMKAERESEGRIDARFAAEDAKLDGQSTDSESVHAKEAEHFGDALCHFCVHLALSDRQRRCTVTCLLCIRLGQGRGGARLLHCIFQRTRL
jgi:hypothetical protein